MNYRTGLIALALLSGQALANELQIGLSNHTADVQYASSPEQANGARLSWLHHEDDGDLLGAGIYGHSTQQNIHIAVGGKLFFSDIDSEQGLGLALGGRLAWSPAPGLNLALQAHYAPSVTSFSDIDGLSEWDLRLTYTVAENIGLFLGYRDVEIDIDQLGNSELHQGGFAGIALHF